MLSMVEIVEKLNVAPVQFNQLMQEEKYCAAKWLFYSCMVTAVFIELDEAAMERLFGEDGAFDQELVKKAYEKAGGGIDRAEGCDAKAEKHGSNVRFLLQAKRILESSETKRNGIADSSFHEA